MLASDRPCAALEQGIPWNPIPTEANQHRCLDVLSVEECCTLSILVASQWQEADAGTWQFGAWRLHFPGCVAYRRQPFDRLGHPRLAHPWSDAALWEVVRSRYLAVYTSLERGYGNPSLHHYVLLTLAGSAYELLATHVHSEPLGQAATAGARRWYQKRTGFSVPDSIEPMSLVQPPFAPRAMPGFHA